MSDFAFLNQNRVRYGPLGSNPSDGFNGMFDFALPDEARRIRCIASDGMGWQHVSVSFGPKSKSMPSWELMCRIKDIFWSPDDTVIQFHPARKDYVNNHPGCLHLWRYTDGAMPLPDPIMVGIPNAA